MNWAPTFPPASARARTLAPKPPPVTDVRFADNERRLLLNATGLGHGVVCRLERVGIHSLKQLQDVGIDSIVDQICEGVGNMAWRNRSRALTRALAEAIGEPGARPVASDAGQPLNLAAWASASTREASAGSRKPCATLAATTSLTLFR